MINNEPVIELDYSSYHFMMLYHKVNIDYQEDPYLAVIPVEELRPLLKLFSQIVINASDINNAQRGFNSEVYFKDTKRKVRRKFFKELLEKEEGKQRGLSII